eukprot:tig00020934_g16094.t1
MTSSPWWSRRARYPHRRAGQSSAARPGALRPGPPTGRPCSSRSASSGSASRPHGRIQRGQRRGSGDEDDGLEQYERFLSLDTDGIFGGISADQAKDQIFGKGARANIKNLNRFLAAPFRLHYGEADGLSKVRGQNTLVIADMEDALAVLLDRTVETSSIPAKIKEKCTERMKQRLQTLNPYEKTRALLEVNRIYRTWTMIMSVDNIPFLPKPDVEPPWETNLATVKEKAARSGITHQSRVHAAKRRDDENSDGGGGAATEHPKKATKKAPAEKKAATEKTNRARKHEEAEDENAAEAAVTGALVGHGWARNGAPRAEKSATGGQNAEDSVKKKKKKKRTPAPKDTEEELETEIEPQLSKKPRAASVKEHTSASSSSKAASGPEKKAAKGKDPEHSGKAQEQSSHRGPKHAPSRDDEASTQAPPREKGRHYDFNTMDPTGKTWRDRFPPVEIVPALRASRSPEGDILYMIDVYTGRYGGPVDLVDDSRGTTQSLFICWTVSLDGYEDDWAYAPVVQGAEITTLECEFDAEHADSKVLNSKKTPPAFKYFLCIRETVKSKSTYKQGHIFPSATSTAIRRRAA